MTPRILVALGCAAALACGGKTDGTGTETDGGTSSHDGSSSGADSPSSGFDSAGFPDIGLVGETSGPTGIICKQGPSGGSSSGGACEIQMTESCSDGSMYSVDCQCPGGAMTGSCSCSETHTMGGGSGGGSPFTGCPICPGPAEAWKACGYPH
jgi:hypothetical protein